MIPGDVLDWSGEVLLVVSADVGRAARSVDCLVLRRDPLWYGDDRPDGTVHRYSLGALSTGTLLAICSGASA